jgi:hypothetical protein
MTKAVLEAGSESAAARTAAATPPSVLAIPASLQAFLMARLDRLGPAKEVAQIGAAIGREFSHAMLGAVASKPETELASALDRLVAAGLLFQEGVPPYASYVFKHALVQDAAYSTLLRRRRRQLHGSIVGTLENQFNEIVDAQPQIMAHHCTEAGLAEKGVGYWLKAGQQAVSRSAMAEAVRQLEKGLRLLVAMPLSPARQQQELDLRIALAPALMATKGYSSPEVAEAFARASALAEQLGRFDHLVALLYGQWAYHCIRSELRHALSHAERLEQVGEARDNITGLLLGNFAHGATRLWLGEFVAARALFEGCRGMNDPVHRAAYVTMTGVDQYLAMLAELSLALTLLGHIDQGRARISKALLAARELGHAHSLAFLLNFVCHFEYFIGSIHETKRYSEEEVIFSTENGFPLWRSYGQFFCGCALTATGRAAEGRVLIAEMLTLYDWLRRTRS